MEIIRHLFSLCKVGGSETGKWREITIITDKLCTLMNWSTQIWMDVSWVSEWVEIVRLDFLRLNKLIALSVWLDVNGWPLIMSCPMPPWMSVMILGRFLSGPAGGFIFKSGLSHVGVYRFSFFIFFYTRSIPIGETILLFLSFFLVSPIYVIIIFFKKNQLLWPNFIPNRGICGDLVICLSPCQLSHF